MAKQQTEASVPIPSGWGLTQAVLHYEGEDLTADPDPFAGSVVIQLRLDAEPGDALEALSATDLVALKGAFSSFQVGKPPASAKNSGPSVEFSFEDDDGRALQQVILYGRRDGHVYTVTGTHVRGARFEAVRIAAAQLAAELL